MLPNSSVILQDTETNNTTNSSGNCLVLPIYKEDPVFCGVEEEWKPRISPLVGLIIWGTLSIVGWVLALIVLLCYRKTLRDAYKSDTVNKSCFGKFVSFMQIIALSIGRVVWEAIDVTIDAYLFYEIEFGRVVDKNIYRNKYVNNAILVFAIFGAAKILFWLILKIKLNVSIAEDINFVAKIMVLLTFLIEDGPELLLEYFYVERFMGKKMAWFLLARDSVLLMVALSVLFSELISICNSYGNKIFKSWKLVCFSNICIGLLMLLRVLGAAYQHYTGKLERSCFSVKDGKLLQVPFSTSCLRQIDYAIAGMFFVSFISVVIIALTKLGRS